MTRPKKRRSALDIQHSSFDVRCFTHSLLPLVILALLAPANPTRADSSDGVEAMKAALEKWVETKQLTSKERQQSRQEEELLHARIELLQARVNDVRTRTDEIRKELLQAQEKQASLDAESAKLDRALATLRDRVSTLESHTQALLKGAPEPLQRKAEVLSQQFPKDPMKTDLTLSLRYQNVIGVLNMMNNFNNEVTLTTEVRELGEGKAMEVRVLYYGLGQAYFCNKDASVAGVGWPGPDGWKWETRNQIGPTVASLIAQQLNEKTPGYEALPVTIRDLGVQTP